MSVKKCKDISETFLFKKLNICEKIKNDLGKT